MSNFESKVLLKRHTKRKTSTRTPTTSRATRYINKNFGHSEMRRSVNINFVNASARLDDDVWCEQMWTHTSKAEGVSRHRAKAKTNDVFPRRTRVYTREENTRIELAGKKRQLERAVNMWRRQITGQRLDARCGFLFLFSPCCSHFVITSMITNSDRLSEWFRMDSMPSER